MEFTSSFIIWSLLGLFLVLLELGHPGLLLFLSIALGAFGAAGATFFTPELGYQLAIFVGLAILGILLTQWYLRRLGKFFNRALGETNVYALVGKRGLVLVEIGEQQTGYVKIDGEVWLAKTVSGQVIAVGQEILVTGTKGCHLIVKI